MKAHGSSKSCPNTVNGSHDLLKEIEKPTGSESVLKSKNEENISGDSSDDSKQYPSSSTDNEHETSEPEESHEISSDELEWDNELESTVNPDNLT